MATSTPTQLMNPLACTRVIALDVRVLTEEKRKKKKKKKKKKKNS